MGTSALRVQLPHLVQYDPKSYTPILLVHTVQDRERFSTSLALFALKRHHVAKP